MKGKLALVFCLLFLLSCTSITRFSQHELEASTSQPVHNLSTGLNYTTIQEAINANETVDGQTILVDGGTYYENVVVNKTLSLIGENPETTTIDGGTGRWTMLVVADNVSVAGFTLKSSRYYLDDVEIMYHPSIVLSAVSNCTISGNIMTGGDEGIALDSSSDNKIFQNNVTANGWAIVLSSAPRNNIYNNEIMDSMIAVWVLNSSDENRIYENTITDSTGVQVSSGSGNTITTNNFTDCFSAVQLEDSNNTVSGNTFVNNYLGLELLSSNSTVDANTFVNDGLYVGTAAYGNTVENNTVNGKPLVYLEGVFDRTIEDAGQVIVVNSTRIQIENLTLSSTTVAAELIRVDNAEITGNNMSSNKMNGVLLVNTSNTNVTGNIFEENSAHGYVPAYGFGITAIGITASEGNNVTGNVISGNDGGVSLSSSANNRIAQNNVTANSQFGILLAGSDANEVEENSFESNGNGIHLTDSSNDSITQNSIDASAQNGIVLSGSSNNNLAGNNITFGANGIEILSSNINQLTGNLVTDNNGNGILIDSSSGNILNGNTMTNNSHNFGVTGENPSDFFNNIDTSNSVNNKPVYYLISQQDQTMSPDAGYIAAVNSTDIRIQNVNIKNNVQGLLLAYTTNSSIQNATVEGCSYGMWLSSCPNVTISDSNITENSEDGIWSQGSVNNILTGNDMTENGDGIFSLNSMNCTVVDNNISGSSNVGLHFQNSSDNLMSGNSITHNDRGILLDSCSGNSVVRNEVANSTDGIVLISGSSNIIKGNTITSNKESGIELLTGTFGVAFGNDRIFHNNVVGNGGQAYVGGPFYGNAWDDGYPSGGNYWGDYSGTDLYSGSNQNVTGGDGIGDTPYVIDSTSVDHYPLMAPFETFNVPSLNASYGIGVVSNSSVSDFALNSSNWPTLSFNVTGADGTTGFCRVAIPQTLTNSSTWDDLWTVTINGTLIKDRTIVTDVTYTYIYFTYHQSTETVQISIPEFPSFLILPLFMIATLLSATIFRRKRNSTDRVP
jgi:parallel beta-helix repeat protein